VHGSITRRAIAVAGTAAMTAALSVAGVGAAQADTSCGQASVEHSVDGGQTWTKDGRMSGSTAPTNITVKLSGTVGDGCQYHVSLASYSTEGPDWNTSGTQTFLGWATATLDAKNPQAALDVSSTAPNCFGQVDLYGNGTKYDGKEGLLPHYPDSSTPTDLITAWNGGAPCTTPTTPPVTTPPTTTSVPSPSDSTTASPAPSVSDTSSPSPTASPSTTGAAPSPSVSDTASPKPTPTTSAAAGGSTKPPTGTPVVKPVSSTASGNLAETGGNGSQTVAFAGGGAALLVIGGGAVYFTRRRNRTSGN
jgi:LPXTG-motif cell wall-anchored protein